TWQDGTPIVWRIEPGVTRLVIGKPPRAGEAGESDAGIELAVALPPSLREVYPSLVHLHLWQISNLTRLPELPESLRTLDVRGCVGLEDLAPICAPLQTLLLEGCP
ncbi:MAG: leucine-rich repeat domain-containing protein, partial [Planctomyces sp.]